MSDPPPRRRFRPRSIIGPFLLIGILAVAVLVGGADPFAGLRLANPDQSRVSEVRGAFAELPERSLVLVGMDADLGTYAELRAPLRAMLDDLLSRDARLAFVSFTPEGRAIAVAELARLREAGTRDTSLLDIGFVAGSEAGMVRAVTELLPVGASGAVADAVRDSGDGIRAFQMAVLVGGVDIGPRSWVEQVGSRLPGLPLVALAPTFMQPELSPMLRTGQLSGLLATVRDGAAYVRRVDAELPPAEGDAARGEGLPSALPVLIGLLAALAVLLRAAGSALAGPRASSAVSGPPLEDSGP